ncbi:hypothetical protein K9M79_03290 [Candidatus Woesearchaeota archaeon]|nr:hypothetical protein [Candidatus Woesearchaeota archaeon]
MFPDQSLSDFLSKKTGGQIFENTSSGINIFSKTTYTSAHDNSNATKDIWISGSLNIDGIEEKVLFTEPFQIHLMQPIEPISMEETIAGFYIYHGFDRETGIPGNVYVNNRQYAFVSVSPDSNTPRYGSYMITERRSEWSLKGKFEGLDRLKEFLGPWQIPEVVQVSKTLYICGLLAKKKKQIGLYEQILTAAIQYHYPNLIEGKETTSGFRRFLKNEQNNAGWIKIANIMTPQIRRAYNSLIPLVRQDTPKSHLRVAQAIQKMILSYQLGAGKPIENLTYHTSSKHINKELHS